MPDGKEKKMLPKLCGLSISIFDWKERDKLRGKTT
jgi:hypothetical protein